MKRLLISDEKTVVKIVHDDDSETSIKTISSCDTFMNEAGEFELNETNRNKYSVFVSTSAGCFMKCNFCYLTLKEMKHKKIGILDTYINLIEALRERTFAAIDGDIPNMDSAYIKLCWMGMGDAFIHSEKVNIVSKDFLEWAISHNYTVGLDGVDLSTVIPKTKNIKKIFEDFKHLETVLKQFPMNPHNDVIVHRYTMGNAGTQYQNRSRFRLFYSLHSAIQETRDELIPNAMPLDEAIPALLSYSENNKYNVIFHHMFIDGFNDSEKEVDALISLIEQYNLQNYELRVLRYNTCEVSTFMHESNHFKNIIKRLTTIHPHVKVQVSSGTEVKAACGQFLTNN